MILREILHNLRMLSALALLGCGLASCVMDNLPDLDDNRFDTDGYSLGITIKLDDGLNTRAVSYDAVDSDPIDNYIDTRNRLRVLFFDENGQFIFEAIDRTVMERSATDGSEWFVHIPVNYVVDTQDKVFDIDALKKQLMEHDFKVAILANWEYRDANGNVTTREHAEPQWGYYNSILCTDTSKRQIKNINDLHHLAYDSIYASGENEAPKQNNDDTWPRPDAYFVYNFLMEDGKMGIRSDWVTSINSEITSTETAAAYIKKNWDPTGYDEKQFDFGYYKNMWYLWSFTAAYNCSGARFSDQTVRASNNEIGWKWVDHNHYKQGYNERTGKTYGADSPLYKFVRSNPLSKLEDTLDDAELTFDPSTYTRTDGNATIAAPVIVQNNNGNDWDIYALRLGNLGGSNQSKDNPRGIAFTASASGTLRVRCASSNSNSVRLAVYNSSNGSSSSIATVSGTTPTDITRSISITGDYERFYIYCDRAGDSNTANNTSAYADIYEIEYIKDKYLNDTNRERVLPTEDRPIPMYGVQNFSKLENWKQGSTFDLSHDNRGEHGEDENGNSSDYEVKHISLIRSLAKVVVYLPALNGNPPTHVYLRSMNRTSRCEPMDVETPTDQLWENSQHPANFGRNQTVYSDDVCEWYLVQAHGSFFELDGQNVGTWLNPQIEGYKNDTSDPTITQAYQNKLAWFYGSWGSAKWKRSGTTMTGWDFGTGANGTNINPRAYVSNDDPTRNTSPHYPHLFNPSINRSDFARIPRDESYTGSGYYRYVIYVPDKNIDDPNYVGVYNSITKVAHIEYRYDDSVMNIDDNGCYRIYFTNYSTNNRIGSVARTEFDNNYELRSSNLAMHWPIMRNHAYIFAVGGTFTRGEGEEGGAPMVVSSKVTTFSGAPIVE